MANGGRRPIAPVRKLIASVLAAVATFVILFGAGLTSWAIVGLGFALLILAVALVAVTALWGGTRAWVAGSAHVVSASEPPASSAFGRCELQIVIDAPGLPAAAVKARDPRVPVDKWPDAGTRLPILVAVGDPRHVRIQWDEVLTHSEAADLTEADLTEADLTEADLTEADLAGSDTAPADTGLTGTDQRDSRLDQPDLDRPDLAGSGAVGGYGDVTVGERVGPDDPTPRASHPAADQPTAERPLVSSADSTPAGGPARPDPATRPWASSPPTEPSPTSATAPTSSDTVPAAPTLPRPRRPSPRPRRPDPSATTVGATTGATTGDTPRPDPSGKPGNTTEAPTCGAPRPRRPENPDITSDASTRETPGTAAASVAGMPVPAMALINSTRGEANGVVATLVEVRPDARPDARPATGARGPSLSSSDDATLTAMVTTYPSARPGPAGAIHGVGITVLVTELARSIAFYRDLLGFLQIDGGEGNAVLASGDTRLVLREVADAVPVNRRMVHLNLEVGDIQQTYQELQAKGLRFTYGPRAANKGERLEQWAAAFRDPDGHGVALTQWRRRTPD